MASQWDPWLAGLKANGKGGVEFPAIDRTLPYVLPISIPLDVSADDFAAALKASPDTDLELMTFSVSVGAYSSGTTVVTLTLTDGQTATLAADLDDGVGEVVFDLLWTPSGDYQRRFMGGVIPVLGKVTDYGS